jgi:type IV secretory pathway TrbD component
MRKTRESNGSGALYLGTLIAIVSVVLWSEYKSYYLGTWISLSAGGFVLWFIGFASTKHLASAGPQVKSELAGSSRELCLKNFYLNGYFFQPVEQETSNGQKQFRLSSTPPLSPDHEAAVIRYLINEGLSDEMWPQISRRIEDEANWAFFM